MSHAGRVMRGVRRLLQQDVCMTIAKNQTLLLFLLLGLLLAVTEARGQRFSLPRFESYPVSSTFRGKPAPVNLRGHSRAKIYRTVLREGAKEGPNFAGHYTVVMWGCGSDCMEVAVVDAKTGRVYFAPFTVTPSMGADYGINSKLFVRNPPERNERPIDEEMMDVYKPSWHVWKGDHFVKLPVRIEYKTPHEPGPNTHR